MFVANFDEYSIAKFETTYADMEVMRKGNGNDWVNDWYAKDYYQHTPEHNLVVGFIAPVFVYNSRQYK